MTVEGSLCILVMGFGLGVGCTWRYWRERIQQQLIDKSKWN